MTDAITYGMYNEAYDEELHAMIKPNSRIIYKAIKRTFDFIVSSLGLILLSPIFIITAIAIKAEDQNGKSCMSHLAAACKASRSHA